ncbi:DUF2087 domain-containing protein [Microtetraspora glauca]|uniref:DUF2087 domain-containing protein n=1 Tax=Microtetraspora glauca TaxID=1996 RepID=A0ABV3G7Q3_MICGL
MTPENLVRLLAEPSRMRVLAAIALGANTPSDIAEASGLSAKDALRAAQRLQDHDLIVAGDDGLRVDYERLRNLSRDIADSSRPEGGEPTESALLPFVQGRRLTTVPAQQRRRYVVLEHIVARSFEPGVAYEERVVNDKLREWCDGGEVDHVAVRRYLIDMGLLTRGGGVYRVKGEPAPEPGVAERVVRAIGLE